jgi:hypothetical protein
MTPRDLDDLRGCKDLDVWRRLKAELDRLLSGFYEYEDCLDCGTYNETCLPWCKGCGSESWR